MKSRQDFTFKHNSKYGRHGWLRLTPAHSIKLVHQILDDMPHAQYVLDPFSGTGTTGLVCGERGLNCDLLDINPFLVWFTEVKTANYTLDQLTETEHYLRKIVFQVKEGSHADLWLPPIQNIDRWWSVNRQELLARLYGAIKAINFLPARNLLLVAFCQKLIEWSNAAFNHQSMSFKKRSEGQKEQNVLDEYAIQAFTQAALRVIDEAKVTLFGTVNVYETDSRCIPELMYAPYDCVITSPPYPNRMSYIRELRPYMYWLGYLNEAREAGELDWKAIGGTWGIATSRVEKWKAENEKVDYGGFDQIIDDIGQHSKLLANYVHKYFVDISVHAASIFPRLARDGRIFYIVGNSKFYDTLLPVEEIYAHIFSQVGFTNVQINTIRKRNSKKELYEFIVSARKP